MCVRSRTSDRAARYDWTVARALRAEGVPLRQIALRLGCSYRAVTLAKARGVLG